MGVAIKTDIDPGQALQSVIEDRRSLRSQLETALSRLSELESRNLEQKELLEKLKIFQPLLVDDSDKLPVYIRDRETMRQCQAMALKLYGKIADITVPDKSQAQAARKVVDMTVEGMVQFVIYNQRVAFERWFLRDSKL